MTKSLFILLFCSTLSGLTFSQKVGDTLPNYIFRDVIKNEQLNLAHFKGKKPIILEFWATWCSPCLPAMKRLESIQKKYVNEIEIITISSDNRNRLVDYSNTTNTPLKIAFDSTHQNIFKYSTIPHTIVVGKSGVIVAIMNPDELTDNFLDSLIKNKEVALKSRKIREETKIVVDTLYESQDSEKRFVLTTFQPHVGSRSKNVYSDSGELRQRIMFNMGIVPLYRQLSSTKSSARLVFKNGLSFDDFPYVREKLLCLTIDYFSSKTKKIDIDIFNQLNAINTVKAVKTIKRKNCYILKKTSNILKTSTSSKEDLEYGGPIYKTQNQDIDKLTNYLENILETPVIDKTELLNRYDIVLNWQLEAPNTLNEELNKYGLKLKKTLFKRKMEVLEIFTSTI